MCLGFTPSTDPFNCMLVGDVNIESNVGMYFNFDEAVNICKEAGIRTLVVHHFGMFEFNTVDQQLLEARAQNQADVERCIVPVLGKWYQTGGADTSVTEVT